MKKSFPRNALVLFNLALALFSGSYCPQTQRGLAMSLDTQPLASPVAGANKLGFKLLSELGKSSKDNILISPFSISQALDMTYNGAAGQTAKEMTATLGIGKLSLEELNKANSELNKYLNDLPVQDKQVTFTSANSLWVAEKLKLSKSFASQVETNYKAEIGSVNFADEATRIRINSWVKDKTKNKISEIIAANTLNNSTKLVLINGVYFKGIWSHPFDKKMTAPQKFTPSNGHSYNVSMMQRQAHYDYAEQDGIRMISLPYGKNKIAMHVILPPQAVSLKDFVSSFSYDTYKTMRDQAIPKDISLLLPKYKLEYGTTGLKQPLKSLGMTQAFNENDADFSKMVDSPEQDKLVISDVLHKATMEIDEQGTVATAATAVVMMAATAMMPLEFKVDRPFLTVIEDKSTGSILFLGMIEKPQ